MNRLTYFALFLVLALGLTGCPDSSLKELDHDGRVRTYRLHVPPAYNASTAVPLVIALHGGAGDSRRMERSIKLNPIADREGFIVAYPDGINNGWNDGRPLPDREDADDVGFLVTLIDELKATYAIDASRIYLMGVSNGGHMTYRFLCERSDLIAAAAPVIANMPEAIVDLCDPPVPVPMLILNGTEDPLVPFDGGPVTVGRQTRGSVLSSEDTAALWAEKNGCDGEPVTTWLPDVDPDDGTTIRVVAYKACSAPVYLYAVEGGGHTWPGGSQYLPEFVIGPTSNELDTPETLWEFFERFS